MRWTASAALIVTLASPSATAYPAPTRTTPKWVTEGPRSFVGTQVDVGFPYVNPRLEAAYGLPHRRWAGLDAAPLVTNHGFGGYLGLRGVHPNADLRVGMLESVTLRRAYLPRLDHYDLRDAQTVRGPNAAYVACDGELDLWLPVVRGGDIVSETQASYLLAVPEGNRVLVLDYPVIAEPPWVVRQRLGFRFAIHAVPGMSVSPVAELVSVPARDHMLVWRAGFTWQLQLFPDTELRASFVPVLSSPDRLGLSGGDTAELGLRWTWATH